MTVINVTAAIQAVGGSTVVESGTVTVEYMRGVDPRPAVRASGSLVALPAPLVVEVVDGAPVVPVDAPATDGGCYARLVVESRVPYVATGFVLPAVAIPATGPVDITALAAVDPASYEPVTTVVTAWQVAVGQVAAMQADVTVKTAQAVEAAADAGTFAGAADFDADRAGQSAFQAGQSAAAALGHKNDAKTSADAAAASAASIVKDVPGGVPTLDGNARVPDVRLPERLAPEALSSTIGAVVTEGVAPKANAADVYSKATARAIFKPNLAPAIDLLGDSITDQCGWTRPVGTQPSGAIYAPSSAPQARGYIIHALTLLGQRLRFGTNFGIGGTTAAQMVARVADVLASTSPIVHVYAGTNDIGNGRTATETKTSLLAIYQALRAAGREVTTATIAPTVFIAGSAITNTSGIAAGVTSFTAPAGVGAGDILTLGPGTANAENVTVQSVTGPSGGVYTITLTAATTKSHARGDLFRNVTRIGRLHDVNQWIIDYTQGRYIDPTTGNLVTDSTGGIHLVDWHSLNADPATGQPFGSIQVDGTVTTVAQNPYVGVVDGVHPGQDLAHRMGHALAVVLDRILPPSPVRTGDNTDAGNLLTNGRAVGNSSGRPTGWSVITSVGTFTATPTKVARTDGVPGEYAQLAIGPGNTGQGQYRVGDVSGLTFDGVSAWTLEVEFETDANLLMQATPPGGGRPLAASVEFRTSSGSLGTAHSHFTASSTDGAGSLWDASGVLRTGPFTPPATATRVLADVILQGIDTGTVRIKTARLRKVA